MKLISLFICLLVFTIAQDFHFKVEKDKKNNVLWTLSYPQKVSGNFVCRLIFNNKDEIGDSRLWLQFKNRNFSYVYQTNNRKILKGKYTLEIYQKSPKSKQSIPRNHHFYIGTAQEIAQQHYDYIKLFTEFSEYMKDYSTTLQKERADLVEKDTKQLQMAQWYEKKRKILNQWQEKTQYFFYPYAVISYDFVTQQHTVSALKVSRKIVDRHIKWLFCQKSLEGLSPQFTEILTKDLPDLEKQLSTLQKQIRTQLFQSSNNNDLQKLFAQISDLDSVESIKTLKIQLQLQQLIFTKNKHPEIAKLLKKIEQVLKKTDNKPQKQHLQELNSLITKTKQMVKNIHLAKNAYDKNYFSSILKKLAKTKGLHQLSPQQLRTLEVNVGKIKEHRCYRSFLGLIYWIKVYKMYKKQPDGEQRELYVEKSKLSIQLLVAELQECLEE